MKINNEKNIDNSFGVSILLDGTPIFFGDVTDDGLLHGEHFKNEVENTKEYKSLNIHVDASLNILENFYLKLPVIASQGVITMCKAGGCILIYSPDHLSDNQAMVMRKFNDEFLSICKMVAVALVDKTGKYTECSLDEYIKWCLDNEEVHVKK